MPFYDFKCGDCGHAFELRQSITAPLPKKCPGCKRSSNFSQVYHAPRVWAYGNPTTVGQMGEINARKAGKEQMELMAESRAKRNKAAGKLPKGMKRSTETYERPFWRDTDEILDPTKLPDVEKYIESGEK